MPRRADRDGVPCLSPRCCSARSANGRRQRDLGMWLPRIKCLDGRVWLTVARVYRRRALSRGAAVADAGRPPRRFFLSPLDCLSQPCDKLLVSLAEEGGALVSA
jgi:hypothetical protein